MPLTVHLALAVVQLLFVGLALAGRVVLKEFPAGPLVLVRVAVAAAVLTTLHVARGRPWVRDRRDLLTLFAAATLGISLNQGFFLFGLAHSTAVNATIMLTTVPAFTVLFSVMLGRERADAWKFGGIAIALSGAVWLIGPDRLSLAPEAALGNGLLLCGMVCYAGYFLVTKTLVGRIESLTILTHVMLFALAGVLPFGLASLRGVEFGAVRPLIWWLIAYIVAGPTITSYLLNTWALRRASPNVVAVYIYLQPLVTAVVAPLLLPGEAITPRTLVGGALILGGVGVVLWSERPRAAAAARLGNVST